MADINIQHLTALMLLDGDIDFASSHDARRVREQVLPDYVRGLVDHWRDSAEDEAERDLVRRIDAGDARF